jgi:hypothetical protein
MKFGLDNQEILLKLIKKWKLFKALKFIFWPYCKHKEAVHTVKWENLYHGDIHELNPQSLCLCCGKTLWTEHCLGLNPPAYIQRPSKDIELYQWLESNFIDYMKPTQEELTMVELADREMFNFYTQWLTEFNK